MKTQTSPSTQPVITNRYSRSISNQKPLCEAMADTDFRIAGVYYWQGHWQHNFWSNVRKGLLAADFRRMRSLGCNTVFLQAPWGVFQPDAKERIYDEDAYASLREILQSADEHGLFVGLRLGTSERQPKGVTGTPLFVPFAALDDQELDAFYDLYRETASRLRDDANLLCMLFGHDDMNGYRGISQQPLNLRRRAAARMGAFREHLEQAGIEEWNRRWRTDYASIDDIPFPAAGSAEYAELLQFIDYRFANVIVPATIDAAQEGNPEAIVTFEANVESSPIPKFCPSKKKGQHTHEATFGAGNAPFTTASFDPAWNAPDGQAFVTPRACTANLKKLRRWLRRHNGGASVFLNRLQFLDTAPKRHYESRLNSEEDISQFLESAVDQVLDKETGYAIWALDAYEGNILENSSFERGFEGWQILGTAEVVDSDRGRSARITSGGSISTTVHAPWNPGLLDENQPFTLRVYHRSPDLGQLELHAETSANGRDWESHGCAVLPLREDWEAFETSFPVDRWVRIKLTATTGNAEIDDLSCFNHVQEGAIFDRDGQPLGRRGRALTQVNRARVI